MKKLVVMGLAMAITVSMMNGVCAQPVHAAKGKGLKVALLMSGAANDQGWNQTAYEGAQKACDKYGCELAYTENLEAADISAAFADYASAGYDVVIGHGYEFGDPALEVAADKLGAIGPIQGDSLVKIVNGYEDGAKSVNPDIEVQTAWTNSFVDTQLAQEAAKAMIENGVDVIKHCANACGNGAIAAAVDADIWCQGDSYDQSSLAPENILDSAIYNLDVVIDKAIESVVDDSFEGDVYNLGMADGAVEVLLSDNLTDEVKATAQDAIDKIVSGELEVERDYTLRD